MAAAEPITIFVCGKPHRVCSACGQRAALSCSAELRGRRAGDKCARALCSRCNEGNVTAPLCGAHARLAKGR